MHWTLILLFLLSFSSLVFGQDISVQNECLRAEVLWKRKGDSIAANVTITNHSDSLIFIPFLRETSQLDVLVLKDGVLQLNDRARAFQHQLSIAAGSLRLAIGVASDRGWPLESRLKMIPLNPGESRQFETICIVADKVYEIRFSIDFITHQKMLRMKEMSEYFQWADVIHSSVRFKNGLSIN